jgi:hypothetical protein
MRRTAVLRRTAALRRTLAAASLLAALLPGTAAADEFVGTRSAALVERSHEIRLVLDHGTATLRVRRAVWNGGPRHDQAEFWIDVPERSVAVGLRTKGTLHGRPHWFEGELLEAELAAQRYRELTGIGGYYPKDPALLSWRDPTLLALQVFPVAPQSEKLVEYTLLLPTGYADGRDYLELPALGTEAHPARVRLETVHPRDQLFVDDEPVGRGHELVLEHVHDLALARHRPPRVAAELASVPFSADDVLVRWNVALAPKLSTIPRDARVVVVIDGSRSWSIEQRRDAREVARAYLEHFADPELRARVEVLVFDRKVHARHGKLVEARLAIADLAHLEPSDANGSHVDAALVRATEVLEAAPDGPRRILLLTDTRTRSELQPARLRALAERSGAIVHVGVVEDDELSLVRNDDHPWARVATSTEGLVWQIGAHSGVPRDDMRAAFEELARPLRIDHLEISAPPLDDPIIEIPESLDEGQGLEAFAVVGVPVEHLRIQGQLWSAPLRHTELPDEDAGRRSAALVFGSELLDELDEAEMMTLALHGGAVSPVTSYLAIEPGVRPSTEGLDEGEGTIGMGSVGLISRGGGSGSGSGFGGSGSPDLRQELLEQRVREALDACGGRRLGTHLELESTLDEIVEIDHVELRGSTDTTVKACLEDGVWATLLPSEFDDELRRWVVDLPAA